MSILFYFPHNPWPPRSGAHQRCLQVLREFKAAGRDVILASSTLHTDQPWSEDGKNALREITGQKVQVYEKPTRTERRLDRIEKKIRLSILRRNGLRESVFCPNSLIRWFRKLAAKTNPETILINYAYFDQLVDHKRWQNKQRVIEIHDLVSINLQMRRLAEKQLDEYAKTQDASKFRDAFNIAKAGFHIDQEELNVYRKYDTVLSISNTERFELQQLLKGVNIVYAPFVQLPSALTKTYMGPPVLSLGPNLFNEQGYVYFHEIIMPEILRQAPDFRLTVTGSINSTLRQGAGIDWKGFVPDRDKLFQEAGYAVCPVFGGTGQQIKIVEAMAHGLAVVAFEEAAKNSFIQDGENGLVARSSSEFARHVVRLQKDSSLRMRLGQMAGKTMKQAWETSSGLNTLIKSLN